MKILFPLIVIWFSSGAQAYEVGFALGNTYKATPLSGTVTVFCQSRTGNPDQANYQCRSVVLEPTAYDYFRGPKGLVADEVTLHATREDGSVRVKTEKYDGRLSRSKNSFNLWISTLFQRPLLKVGRNKIDYTLVQDGTTVGQGQFQVLVQTGTPRRCPHSQYNSFDPNDCVSPYTVCERYFYQYNNCTID